MGVSATAYVTYGIDLGPEHALDLSNSIHANVLFHENGKPLDGWDEQASGLFEEEGVEGIELLLYGSPAYGHWRWILSCADLQTQTQDFNVGYPAAPRGDLKVHKERLRLACQVLGVPYSLPAWLVALRED